MSEQKTPVVPKSLGFLFADWIAAHCVVPNGYDLGKPFELVGWQLDNAIDFYRVKPDAVYDPARPRQAAAFKWRRGQIVGGQKLGKSPFGAAVAAFEGVGALRVLRLGQGWRDVLLLRLGLLVRFRICVFFG